MAHSRSAKKRVRQNLKLHARNQALRTRYRRLVRKSRALIEAKDAKSAAVTAETCRSLDKIAAKGIIHPNKAARLKSRLTRKANALAAQAPAAEPPKA
ncbi:MAG TPA: 30S ribosomal protein S20 [Candidatus Brocadiia bacterium]|nr:30S ribosomal protein S20 [Candidatus Brocadiia bacterium]